MLRECKVAEAEEAQEHANSTVGLCAPNKTLEDLWLTSLVSPDTSSKNPQPFTMNSMLADFISRLSLPASKLTHHLRPQPET
jgi:hypothetical protein